MVRLDPEPDPDILPVLDFSLFLLYCLQTASHRLQTLAKMTLLVCNIKILVGFNCVTVRLECCEENYSLLKTNILLALYKEILNWAMTSSSELRTSLMNSVTRNEIYIITLIKWKRMASYKLCPHGELQRNVWRVWLLNRGPQPRSSASVLRHVSRLSKIVRQPSKVNTPDRLENNTKYFS